MQIAVVDLGIGNLRSVEQALRVVASDANVVVTSERATIENADKIVLPGQGAVGTWFEALRARQLEAVIQDSVGEKPILGICVGMQALFAQCEENGGIQGLNLFNGSVRHFKHFHELAAGAPRPKIPQMGWNRVAQTQDHPIWQDINDRAYFYFVHSYCANLTDGASTGCVYGQADYEHKFIAAVGDDNIFAVQFHPEKSHDDGLRLLKNFTRWDGKA